MGEKLNKVFFYLTIDTKDKKYDCENKHEKGGDVTVTE